MDLIVETVCPTCQGYGVMIEEPFDWWYGSKVNAVEYDCRDCNGTGNQFDIMEIPDNLVPEDTLTG